MAAIPIFIQIIIITLAVTLTTTPIEFIMLYNADLCIELISINGNRDTESNISINARSLINNSFESEPVTRTERLLENIKINRLKITEEEIIRIIVVLYILCRSSNDFASMKNFWNAVSMPYK